MIERDFGNPSYQEFAYKMLLQQVTVEAAQEEARRRTAHRPAAAMGEGALTLTFSGETVEIPSGLGPAEVEELLPDERDDGVLIEAS